MTKSNYIRKVLSVKRQPYYGLWVHLVESTNTSIGYTCYHVEIKNKFGTEDRWINLKTFSEKKNALKLYNELLSQVEA